MLITQKTRYAYNSNTKAFLFGFLTVFMTYTPLPIIKLIFLIIDVSTFWIKYIINKLKNSKERVLLNELNRAKNWESYYETANNLDYLFSNNIWKDNLVSSKYDYKLIQERLQDLKDARLLGNVKRLLSLLRAGMIRNFGGISNKKLYNRTYTGTKILIEEYNKEVLQCLESIDNDKTISEQLKLDFYHDTKTTLGTTALCLHGGSLFGLCHLGVVKSLINSELLPNVIVGSGLGAAIGALVSCLDREELLEILDDFYHAIDGKSLKLTDSGPINNDRGDLYIKWIDNLKRGLTEEIKLFINFTIKKIGQITFKQAFQKTGKSFNILLYPTNSKIPTLLNYLSTPYVTIDSSIYCSMGDGILDEDIKLELMIDYYGKIAPYASGIKTGFQPPYQVTGNSIELKNSQYDRITELFNVNQFIISISRPYLAPFIHSNWKIIYNNTAIVRQVWSLVSLEIKHRIRILSRLGLLTTLMQWLLVDEKTILVETNHIPIIPVGSNWIVWDIIDLFNQNKTVSDYWIGCGERSVWSMHSLLETRCRMEFLLNDYYEKYRKM